MISIQCNGSPRELREGTTVAELVVELGVGDKKFAVERNREVVPRAELGAVTLEEGDEVNVVTLVGGG